MASVRFEIGTTPNPNSIRVGLSEALFAKAATYANAQAAEADPLAKKLFEIPGVTQVFTLNNFISINKDPAVDWSKVEPRVAQVLQGHFGA